MLHYANSSDNYLLQISSFDDDDEDPLKLQYSPLFSLSPSLEDFAYDDPLHNSVPDSHHIKILPQPPDDPIQPAPKENGGTGRRKRRRTDRHSKIQTLQGLRDRRMRLSVDVAGRFFALQDMLGFDKASSTIDWLLNQSSHAIIEHRSRLGGGHFYNNEKAKPLPSAILSGTTKKSRRESRNEARARARRRTLEKKKIQIGQHEKVVSPAGTVEYSNCSSLVIQGSKDGSE